MSAITGEWQEALSGEFKKPYYRELYRFLQEEYRTQVVYPRSEDIFNAFHHTPLPKVRVVLLGQDPYHEPGQAHGLSFSVPPGVPKPPSLQNIFQELSDDLHIPVPESGCLIPWAEQGVLLLNSLLTVRAHQAGSHRGKGWEEFTDAAVRVLAEEDRPMVFFLWGSHAREKARVVHDPRHLVIESSHPSPLSAYRGFFGSRPFSQANRYLEENGLTPIDWEIR